MILINIVASIMVLLSDAGYTQQEVVDQPPLVLEAAEEMTAADLLSRQSQIDASDVFVNRVGADFEEEAEDSDATTETVAAEETEARQTEAVTEPAATEETEARQTEAVTEPVATEEPKPQTQTRQTQVARVTAYSPFDNQNGISSDGNPNQTSTGQRPGPTIIAVDPQRIPYGTKVRIEGFDRTFVAGDTGSAMRSYDGVAIDVFFESYDSALRFGVQYLEFEIVADG